MGKQENEYPVYPQQEGEWDRPINPYSPVIYLGGLISITVAG
jgi:hypothetical protein